MLCMAMRPPHLTRIVLRPDSAENTHLIKILLPSLIVPAAAVKLPGEYLFRYLDSGCRVFSDGIVVLRRLSQRWDFFMRGSGTSDSAESGTAAELHGVRVTHNPPPPPWPPRPAAWGGTTLLKQVKPARPCPNPNPNPARKCVCRWWTRTAYPSETSVGGGGALLRRRARRRGRRNALRWRCRRPGALQ